MPSKLDEILQPFKLQYYYAIKGPSDIFEQMLVAFNQQIQTANQIIKTLEEENQQLRLQLAKKEGKK